jgi:hypothetical protein
MIPAEVVERDLRKALEDDLEQIEDNARLYYTGRHSAYQVVAIQLRNLLLSGRRGLLLRVLPGTTLHALRPPTPGVSEPDPPGQYSVLRFESRGSLELKTGPGGGARLRLEFTDELLSVEKWLDQWVLNDKVTLRRLIEATADQEVAHTAPSIAEVIRSANIFQFGGAAKGRNMHTLAIVALGEYVVLRTRDMLMGK